MTRTPAGYLSLASSPVTHSPERVVVHTTQRFGDIGDSREIRECTSALARSERESAAPPHSITHRHSSSTRPTQCSSAAASTAASRRRPRRLTQRCLEGGRRRAHAHAHAESHAACRPAAAAPSQAYTPAAASAPPPARRPLYKAKKPRYVDGCLSACCMFSNLGAGPFEKPKGTSSLAWPFIIVWLLETYRLAPQWRPSERRTAE